MDQTAKDSIVARLQEATNVLVTVRANPSVDELAACIGFTLLINKLGKRGAAVFSGKVPSTIEFLQPEKTLEKTTDSLRDFIIALDKTKADKLRYKVEDKVVKIFITPYRTHISEKDLDFSQGDFNVDVVVALGVHEKDELDQAIVAHGRILHDATVISVNNKDQGNLGSINWVDLQSSSLCEMMVTLGQKFNKEVFDTQMATAFLTGIVAETDRFSNEKTSPQTMSIASTLMAAGANQQLIATKLEEPLPLPKDTKGGVEIENPDEAEEEPVKNTDGSLKISHDEPTADDTSSKSAVADDEEKKEAELPELTIDEPEAELPAPKEDPVEEPVQQEEGEDGPPDSPPPELSKARATHLEDSRPAGMALTPPQMGGRLTANTVPEHMSLDPSTDPLSAGNTKGSPLLSRSTPPAVTPQPPKNENNEPKDQASTTEAKTLSSIEESVASPHLEISAPAKDETESATEPAVDIEDAREAVDEAIKFQDPAQNLEPIKALGAQPIDLNLGHGLPADNADNTLPAVDELPELPPVPASFSSPEPPLSPLAAPAAQPPTHVNEFPLPVPGQAPSLSGPTMPMPPNLVPQSAPVDQSGSAGPATPPPPVPPPMMPPLPQ